MKRNPLVTVKIRIAGLSWARNNFLYWKFVNAIQLYVFNQTYKIIPFYLRPALLVKSNKKQQKQPYLYVGY